MNLTLSPQIKIIALVGVLAAVGLMASLTLLGGHSSSGTTDVTSVQRAPRRNTATTPAKPATTPAKTHTTPAKPTTTPAKTAAKPHVHAKPKPRPKPVARGNLVYSTLPSQLQYALSQHDVVVVSTYDPNADVDKIAAAEAYAGANDAKVGFLLVNVLDDAVAGRLTALLPGGGLLPDPGVLVYKAPGNIAFRFDGFVDRATVAQAAANATQGEATGATAG